MHGDLLPINNDENFAKAKSVQKSFLKIVLQAKGRLKCDPKLLNGVSLKPITRLDLIKGESYNGLSDFNKKRNFFDNLNNLLTHSNTKTPKLEINLMEDFHQVSSIIDADVLPKTCRRVRITKHGSDKPLGFYIRDGFSVRLTPQGLQKVPSIFISRVLPGGLAESTGLLAVNDEVLEVNGIDLLGKSIEMVTDMMVANSANLILTIKPVSQNHLNDSFISTRSNTSSLPRNVGQQQLQRSLQHQQQAAHADQTQRRNEAQRYSGLQPTQPHQSLKPSNVLQPSVQQQNSLQSNLYHQQQYSSLRNNHNQSSNQQKGLIQFQQNSSFNYQKSLSSHGYQQQENQQNSNPFISSSRQHTDSYSRYVEMQERHAYQAQQSKSAIAHSSSFGSSAIPKIYKNEDENGAVSYENTPNKSLIDCLRRNYFGVEPNYEEEDEDDEQDEVMDYVNLNKMVNDKLKLRNVYQNTSNNQGLNVN